MLLVSAVHGSDMRHDKTAGHVLKDGQTEPLLVGNEDIGDNRWRCDARSACLLELARTPSMTSQIHIVALVSLRVVCMDATLNRVVICYHLLMNIHISNGIGIQQLGA